MIIKDIISFDLVIKLRVHSSDTHKYERLGSQLLYAREGVYSFVIFNLHTALTPKHTAVFPFE